MSAHSIFFLHFSKNILSLNRILCETALPVEELFILCDLFAKPVFLKCVLMPFFLIAAISRLLGPLQSNSNKTMLRGR